MQKLITFNKIIIITYFVLLTLFGISFAKFQILPFIYTTEFFLFISSIITILIIWQTKQLPEIPKTIWIPTILVFLWACFELIYGLIINHNFVYSLRQFAPFLYISLIPIIIYSFRDKKDINLLLMVIFTAGVLDGMIKVLANISIGHYSSIGIAALIGLYLYFNTSAPKYRYLILICYFILTITIFNFPTRGLWIAFIAAILMYLVLYYIQNKSKTTSISISIILSITIIGGLLGVFLAKDSTDILNRIPILNNATTSNTTSNTVTTASNNIKWRLYVWRDMIEECSHKPILGYGLGHRFFSKTINQLHWGGYIGDTDVYKTQYTGLDPHNSHLHIFYMMGIIGFVLFESLFLFIFIHFLRGINRSLLTNILLSGILFILVLANVEVVLESPYMVIYLWLFVGLILVGKNIHNLTVTK